MYFVFELFNIVKKVVLCGCFSFVTIIMPFAQSSEIDDFCGFLQREIERGERVLQEKQMAIKDFSYLPGTYWVPDNFVRNDPHPSSHYGYIFLNDGLLLVVNIEGYNSYLVDKTVFHILSILSAIKYQLDENRIIITNRLTCYLEDTYLYAGNEKHGFIKYRLDSTFLADSILQDYNPP
jgi:hypothetical protein